MLYNKLKLQRIKPPHNAAGKLKQKLLKQKKPRPKFTNYPRRVKLMPQTPENEHLTVQRLQVLETNSESVTLFWAPIESEHRVEYQLRFFRTQSKTEGWSYSKIVEENRITISNLKKETLYTFSVQARVHEEGEESPSPFGADSTLVEVATSTLAKEERLENFKRVTNYLYNINEFENYPEPEHKKDTYLDKASRGFDGLLNVASFVGFGGQYLKVAKNLWSIRGIGLAAVIFRKELQSIVVALGSQLIGLGKELGLSTKETMVGTYYYLWETKKIRVNNPNIEYESHFAADPDVLYAKAPEDMILNLAEVFVLSRLSYIVHPSNVQWILNGLDEKRPDLKVVCFRGRAGHQKPAFCLLASENKKEVFLCIRGTAELEDLLTNHSFLTIEVDLNLHNGETKKVAVHNGFYQAAKWMLSGLNGVKHGEFETREVESVSIDDMDTEDGAGMYQSLLNFYKAGYAVNITGHSLGSAVSVLLGLLLLNLDPDIKLNVTGYATPCCVDQYISSHLVSSFCEKNGLSERTCERTEAEKNFFSRINLVNFIVRDDLVPRLSVESLRQCVYDIRRSKPTWEKYVSADAKSLGNKVKSLWAPNQRADPKHQRKAGSFAEASPGVVEASEEQSEFEFITERQVVPGAIIHSYRHNGVDKASVVTSDFKDFTRIMAFENLKKDHLADSVAVSLHSVLAANHAKKLAPQWQAGEMNKEGEVVTKCGVCGYFVGWNSYFGSTSGAEEIKSSLHCHGCGKIVCPGCAQKKKSLFIYGIVRECRICDRCDAKYSIPTLSDIQVELQP
eukprot:snap_masked-scaffold_1-processed-gene-32.29-mRNA-1 protein AED:1.00 eAED:1.00 QI:0/-1/0/0/-1/1/1/0/791